MLFRLDGHKLTEKQYNRLNKAAKGKKASIIKAESLELSFLDTSQLELGTTAKMRKEFIHMDNFMRRAASDFKALVRGLIKQKNQLSEFLDIFEAEI